MGKKDLIKSIIAVFVIVVLAILIINVNKLISPKQPIVKEEVDSIKEVVDYGECFSNDLSTVVFVYSNSCPYCNKMKPFIGELETEGYKFYWAEGSDSEARAMVTDCFGDLLGKYVPQFICPATGTEQTGAMSKDQLRKFSNDCISKI